MGKITDRLPKLGTAALLLAGAMTFAAGSVYVYAQLTSVASANSCEGLGCDPGDPDDCGPHCICETLVGTCFGI